jgi:NADPH:quinone reductase-like Zn-dependent oxidoreductase
VLWRALMKACRVHEFGGPEVIRVEEVERPEPCAGELLVRVVAAGVGPWDGWVRAGKSVLDQPLPLTLGTDVSGVVAAVGPGVKGFVTGQDVFGVTNPRFTGAHAEYAVAQIEGIAPKPKRLGHRDAAGAPVIAVTASQMLFDHARVVPGERVLVHGAGGNVGSLAVQLARASGAKVTATDTGPGLEYARSLSDHVIDMGEIAEGQLEDAVRDVDIVIDTVGGEVQRRSFAMLKKGGRLVSSVSEPDAQLAARHEVAAKFMLVKVTTSALLRLGELLGKGDLVVRIGRGMPLESAREAHEMLDGLRPRPPGKIVLDVG